VWERGDDALVEREVIDLVSEFGWETQEGRVLLVEFGTSFCQWRLLSAIL
jgi:hypothetical protein